MDSSKLLKNLTLGRGAILAPHIDLYLERGVFPDKWDITIENKKEERDHGETTLRFSAGEDGALTIEHLYEKHTKPSEEKISAALRKTFDVGTMWHGYLENIVVDMKMVKPENVERYVLHKVVGPHGEAYGSGIVDMTDVQIPGHGSWLVDIKTQNKALFEKGLQGHMLHKYTAQVNLYLDWFDQKKGLILCICKDSPHEMREYQITKDDQLIAQIYERWSYVTKCIREGINPLDITV